MATGKKIPDYGPILLALGNFVTKKGWRDICLLEVEGGMIVQGTGLVSTREGYQCVIETKLFSHDELAQMTAQKK